MHKKLLLIVLISSPLLAMDDGKIKRDPGKFVVPPRFQDRDTMIPDTNRLRNVTSCPSFMPRIGLVLLAVAVGAVSGIAKNAASFKAD